MATNTYVALDTKTVVGTTTAAVEFTSIPQGYTDLRLVINTLGTSLNNQDVLLYVGTGGTIDTTNSNYSETALRGNGTTATSARYSAPYINSAAQYQTNSNYVHTVDFMNYSNSTTYKTYLSRGNNAAGETNAIVLLWRNTGAITNVRFTTGSGSIYINAGSTFTLYGIANADKFTKATGGIISEDSTYTYHVFGSSGTFTPKQALTADILVIAGGGGAGYYGGGGGGAGGVQYATSQSLSATGYTVTIGGGGPSKSGSAAGNGTVGVDSSFSSLVIAKGGGYGAGSNSTGVVGGNGGSGGGGGGVSGTPAGGTATAGTGGTFYGNNGGPNGAYAGSGGGAGAAGTSGGAGGVGTSVFSTWGLVTGTGQNVSGTYYYAGGGGANSGAAGGYGGGGAWLTSGTANTGGGGGADQNGGGGGSGIVIVRYAK